jgi:sugar/nucleoside kinase (ribokinase family)
MTVSGTGRGQYRNLGRLVVTSTNEQDPLVCAVGDLVEDVLVRTHHAAVRGSDVAATVERHRGGSAANTAAVVARLGGRARFVGPVGADDTGERLFRALAALGVECVGPRVGRAGTVVVIVEPDGERTMFSDRGAARELPNADEQWLDGARVVHVPYYAIAETPHGGARMLLDAARRRGMIVSMDPSTSVLAGAGFARLVRGVEPDVVFCNADEAKALALDDRGVPGANLVVVKQGPLPVLLRGSTHADVEVPPLADAIDTTGAGDAFAGGFLLAFAHGADPVDAVAAGFAAAACVVRGPGADSWVTA